METLKKIFLLLRKGVYPYKYMDSWEIFNETSLLDKEAFNSKFNLEDCTDEDYTHYQEVFKELELKNLGDYDDLYAQYDTLLLADVFENFRKKCIEIYELDPAHFLSDPGLAWEACLEKTRVKLELLTDYDILLMVEKGIRTGKSEVTHKYAKANNKFMKNHDKNIESSYPVYLDANNLYGLAMSQKLLVDGFEWIKELSKFNESFIKNYDENSNEGYFLEVDVKYPKKLFNHHSDSPFLPERKKIGKCKKLVCTIQDKENYVDHIRMLRQALNRGLILKKVHRVIQFNQKACLKPYIDMNTKKKRSKK